MPSSLLKIMMRQQQQQVTIMMRILIRIPTLLLLLLLVVVVCPATASSSSSSSRKTRGGGRDTTTITSSTTATTTTTTKPNTIDYKEAFQQHIAPNAFWPCRSKSHEGIVSLTSTEMDIDCSDSSVVVAAYTGTIQSISSNSILLKHTFDDDSVGGGGVQYQHSTTKTWYTLYKGLEEVNTNLSNMIIGDVVTGGTSLGFAALDNNIITFQVMVGASCSLNYAKSNPLDSCNRKNYEPYVNPLMLYPSLSSSSSSRSSSSSLSSTISIDTILPVNSEIQQHGIISITMSPTPVLLNRLVVTQVVGGDTHSVLELFTSSSSDEEQYIGSYQQISDTEWTLAVVVPYTFINKNNAVNSIKLSVYDVYDELIGEELVG